MFFWVRLKSFLEKLEGLYPKVENFSGWLKIFPGALDNFCGNNLKILKE